MTTYNNILLLDIDGVLHPDDAAYLDNDNEKPLGVGLFRWTPNLLRVLKEFPDVKIVISSTWRLLWKYPDLLKLLPPELGEKIIDTTPTGLSDRYEAIQAWIKAYDVKNYVILDDDYQAFPYKLPQLVRCYPKSGLGREQTIEELISHLKNFK